MRERHCPAGWLATNAQWIVWLPAQCRDIVCFHNPIIFALQGCWIHDITNHHAKIALSGFKSFALSSDQSMRTMRNHMIYVDRYDRQMVHPITWQVPALSPNTFKGGLPGWLCVTNHLERQVNIDQHRRLFFKCQRQDSRWFQTPKACNSNTRQTLDRFILKSIH